MHTLTAVFRFRPGDKVALKHLEDIRRQRDEPDGYVVACTATFRGGATELGYQLRVVAFDGVQLAVSPRLLDAAEEELAPWADPPAAR